MARYGSNPLEVINNVKLRLQSWRRDFHENAKMVLFLRLLVPFYDRTGLINETIGTLESSLTLEILVLSLTSYCNSIKSRPQLLFLVYCPWGYCSHLL